MLNTEKTTITVERGNDYYTLRLYADASVDAWERVPEPENEDVLPSVARSVDLYIYDGKVSRIIEAEISFAYVDGHICCGPRRRLSLKGCREKTLERLLNKDLRSEFLAAADALGFALLPYAKDALYG